MKYKIGDKVEIKTWAELENEYGSNTDGILRPSFANCTFVRSMEKDLEAKFKDRILIIKRVSELHYYTEENGWSWHDYMIKEPVEKNVIFEPIDNRFELMDFE